MAEVSIPSAEFQKLLGAVESQSASIADGLKGSGSRVWMTPPELTASPLKPDAIAEGFSRKTADEAYQQALSDSEKMGQAMAAKIELDYVANMERAYRMRQLRPPRAMAHAAARRAGHGTPGGTHSGVVLKFVTDIARLGKLQEASE